MKITFATKISDETGAIARVVDEDTIPQDLPEATREAARRSRFAGKAGQVFEGFTETGGKVRRLVLAGAGKPGADDREAALERAGGAMAAKLLTSGEKALAIDFSAGKPSAEDVAAVLLGARLRAWRFDSYRTTLKDEQKVSLAQIEAVGAPDGAETAWSDADAVARGVELTRTLVTEPGNAIYPASFVEKVTGALDGSGVKIRVLEPAEMEKLGMRALLGVAQGSENPARLLVMEWMNGKSGDAPIALVGKGVTFDSGGISIKPGKGMEDMKFDMGGAAAVAGAMLALSSRKAPANVVGICGLVENMPDGRAQRPGDVVKSMSGQTVEVINTDAEGRLVLCDALTFVQQEYKPARIVDLATLTGAIIVALAHEYAGLFSNDDTLAGDLSDAGSATGDKLWRFPIGPAYDKLIDSPIADMKNVGGPGAGSITAAQFLHRFIDDGTPWAHLDIAGTVWTDKPGPTWEKGASGFGVRLLDRFVRNTAQG